MEIDDKGTVYNQRVAKIGINHFPIESHKLAAAIIGRTRWQTELVGSGTLSQPQ